MEINKENKEFNVLGVNVKLSTDAENDIVSAEDVVKKVELHSSNLIKRFPNLGQKQIAVLCSLELAKDLLEVSYEYDKNIDTLESSARDALQYIEEVSPSVM